MHIPALSEDMLLNDDTRDGVEHKSKKELDFINSIKMISHLADDTGGD